MSVEPLTIRHCSTGGIRTDTSAEKWAWCGWLNGVEPQLDAVSGAAPSAGTRMTVTAEIGATVNLRKSCSTKSAILMRVPIGSVVEIWDSCDVDGWVGVKYKGKTGYMMAAFLTEENG